MAELKKYPNSIFGVAFDFGGSTTFTNTTINTDNPIREKTGKELWDLVEIDCEFLIDECVVVMKK